VYRAAQRLEPASLAQSLLRLRRLDDLSGPPLHQRPIIWFPLTQGGRDTFGASGAPCDKRALVPAAAFSWPANLLQLWRPDILSRPALRHADD
jgi:hypothetical protein